MSRRALCPDDRQITHLIGVRLKDFLEDFLGGVLSLLPVVFLCKSWDPAGLVWHGKRPKARNGKKMEIEMENRPKLDGGKNGKKMAQKWFFEGVFHYFSIFGPFFCHFCPRPAWGGFPFSISHFFFHFRLLAVFHAIPARQDPNAKGPKQEVTFANPLSGHRLDE